MAKEKIGFIESLKQKREDRKLSKELLELLQTGKDVPFEKYDKLPIKTAEELINHGYGEKVIENIEKFTDNYGEVIDKLIDAKYDVSDLLLDFPKNNSKYNLTVDRILKLIGYKPGIICLVDMGRAHGVTGIGRQGSSKDLRWERWVLTDYECYKYGVGAKAINNIHGKYVQMSDAQINTKYSGKLYDENGLCTKKNGNFIYVEDTYGYDKRHSLEDSITERIRGKK